MGYIPVTVNEKNTCFEEKVVLKRRMTTENEDDAFDEERTNHLGCQYCSSNQIQLVQLGPSAGFGFSFEKVDCPWTIREDT
jgi:hypothetical protein